MRGVLLAELVACSDAVAATTKRSEKVATIAALLRQLDTAELVIGVAMLTGEARQGRIGVGWATVGGLDVPPADEPSLSIADLDATLTALARYDDAERFHRILAEHLSLGGAYPRIEDWLRRVDERPRVAGVVVHPAHG